MVSKILIFALIVGTASAGMWGGIPPTKPAELAHKQGCYVKEINDVIPFGKSVNPIGVCYSIYCQSQSMMVYVSCITASTGDRNCHVTDQDLSKPYPDCCPGIKCDIDNKLF